MSLSKLHFEEVMNHQELFGDCEQPKDNGATESSDDEGVDYPNDNEIDGKAESSSSLSGSYNSISGLIPEEYINADDETPPANKPIVDNYVVQYLMKNHPQYYAKMIQHKDNEAIQLPAPGEDKKLTEEKKVELGPQSEKEKEAERLAKIIVDHEDFEEKIKKPLDKKKEEEKKSQSSQTPSINPEKLNPGDMSVKIDENITYIKNNQSGRAVVVEKKDSTISYKYFDPKTVPDCNTTEDPHAAIHTQMPIDIRRKLALARFIVEARSSSIDFVRRLSWKAWGKKETMASVLLQEYGWNMPKTQKLSNILHTNVYTATAIRKLWIECARHYSAT